MARKKPIRRARTNIRTINGTFDDTNGVQIEILLDDGDINATHELLEWKIWPVSTVTPIHTYIQGSTKPDVGGPGAPTNKAKVNNQYAWAGYALNSTTNEVEYYEVTDDGSLLVDNVYICVIGAGAGVEYNYRIRLRETTSTDNQAILGIIKQHSQDLDEN